jgi:HSP20 family protein
MRKEAIMPISDLLPWNRERSKYELQRKDDQDLTNLRNEMNSMFDEFFSNPFSMSPLWRRMEMQDKFIPGIDVSETDKEILISADLPGMDEKDIHLSIEGDVLTLSGNKIKDTTTKNAQLHNIERSYGSFSRSISLPVKVEIDKIDASFNKGVLKIIIPKAASIESQVKKIPIKTK